MAGRSFAARYPGTCPSCDERIHVGDEVHYSDEEQVEHVTCRDRPGRRENPVCPTCWLAHAGDCP